MIKIFRTTAIFLCLTLCYLLTGSFLYPSHLPEPESQTIAIDTIAKALTVPWDICFLPGDDMLFTERNGRVRLIKNNWLVETPVLTVPGIEVQGKMGLLGMCLHPNFALNHYVYLAYNYRRNNQTFLRVARFEYRQEKLINPETIIENIPGVFNHTGSRLKFGPDQKLYITTGDADVPVLAQDLKAYNGKILRLNDDGSIPKDNPFKTDSVGKAVWTYGHRNAQGISFQPGSGILFSSEHGPTGGDEINIIRKGANYGWPVTHHRDSKAGMLNPIMEFSPSIGPAATLFYSGKAFPALKGNLLVGCMRGEALLNIHLNGVKVSWYNYLLKNKFGRIRAVAEDSKGWIYISTSQVDPPESRMQAGEDDVDMILRLRPAKSTDASASLIRLDVTTKLTTAINEQKAAPQPKQNLRSPAVLYSQLCSSCHGDRMQGKEKIPSLVDNIWLNGSSKPAIFKSINEGIINKGMPAWKGVLTPGEINAISSLIQRTKDTGK